MIHSSNWIRLQRHNTLKRSEYFQRSLRRDEFLCLYSYKSTMSLPCEKQPEDRFAQIVRKGSERTELSHGLPQ